MIRTLDMLASLLRRLRQSLDTIEKGDAPSIGYGGYGYGGYGYGATDDNGALVQALVTCLLWAGSRDDVTIMQGQTTTQGSDRQIHQVIVSTSKSMETKIPVGL